MKRWSWMQTRQTKSSFQGPKSYRDFRETGPAPGLRKGVKSGLFWSEIWSGFWEPCGTPPPRIPRSTSRVPGSCFLRLLLLLWILNRRDNSNTRHSMWNTQLISMLQSVIWCKCILVTSMLISYHARYKKQLKTNHVNWPKNVARNPGERDQGKKHTTLNNLLHRLP